MDRKCMLLYAVYNLLVASITSAIFDPLVIWSAFRSMQLSVKNTMVDSSTYTRLKTY